MIVAKGVAYRKNTVPTCRFVLPQAVVYVISTKPILMFTEAQDLVSHTH